nr:hypothetical protein [Tanacetum cinerariifolium]
SRKGYLKGRRVRARRLSLRIGWEGERKNIKGRALLEE